MRERQSWFILTPEYPPHCGGVGDYVRLLARGLNNAGDRVEVATPAQSQPPLRDSGVSLVLLPDQFGRASVSELRRSWRALPDRTVVLVQYTPHAFGLRGMNVPFAGWLASRRERLWFMIHEAIFPFLPEQPLRHDVLAATSRATLRLATLRAERAFISTPAWEPFMRTWCRAGLELEWLPIPATISSDSGSKLVGERRAERKTVIHFGTYGDVMLRILEPILVALVARMPDLDILLIGRGSERYADAFRVRFPASAHAVRATGEVDGDTVGRLLHDSDVALLPFSDGASTRRTTLMSALAAAAAVVTTDGRSIESIWRASGAVELYDPEDPSNAAWVVERLLGDASRRAELRRRARALYDRRFHMDRVVARLRELHAERITGTDSHPLQP